MDSVALIVSACQSEPAKRGRGRPRGPSAAHPRKLIGTSELAVALGVSRATVVRLGNEGRIPYIPISKFTRRYDLDEVLRALREAEMAAKA